MKQYEILWVPVDKESSPQSTRLETNCGTLDAIENHLVITIEELEKVWNAGWRAKVFENHPTVINKDFKSYITSKGVTLP